jgi:hypothetical protein
MKMVQFKDVAENTQFVMDSVEYKKIAEKKVSCCRSINAVSSTDEKKKIQVTPLTEVQVND